MMICTSSTYLCTVEIVGCCASTILRTIHRPSPATGYLTRIQITKKIPTEILFKNFKIVSVVCFVPEAISKRTRKKKYKIDKNKHNNPTTDTNGEHVALKHCRRDNPQISHVFIRMRGFLPPNDYGDTGGRPANYCVVESGKRLSFYFIFNDYAGIYVFSVIPSSLCMDNDETRRRVKCVEPFKHKN